MWRGSTLKLIDLNLPLSPGLLNAPPDWAPSRYCAPELRTGQLTECCNIYSMGALLFFLVTGRRPDPKASEQHPRTYNKRINPHFDAIVAKATAQDPQERYASIAQIRNCQHLARLFYSAK
ncbi:MAG TPA: hypothetical protein V6D17_15015, partial [Candidatus Obscuribacterales bacterium]